MGVPSPRAPAYDHLPRQSLRQTNLSFRDIYFRLQGRGFSPETLCFSAVPAA